MDKRDDLQITQCNTANGNDPCGQKQTDAHRSQSDHAQARQGGDMFEGLLLLNFIVPFVMVLVGIIQRKFPVDNMGAHKRA